jgi:hypothetical protein
MHCNGTRLYFGLHLVLMRERSEMSFITYSKTCFSNVETCNFLKYLTMIWNCAFEFVILHVILYKLMWLKNRKNNCIITDWRNLTPRPALVSFVSNLMLSCNKFFWFDSKLGHESEWCSDRAAVWNRDSSWLESCLSGNSYGVCESYLNTPSLLLDAPVYNYFCF